jgi:hypothetical protein
VQLLCAPVDAATFKRLSRVVTAHLAAAGLGVDAGASCDATLPRLVERLREGRLPCAEEP